MLAVPGSSERAPPPSAAALDEPELDGAPSPASAASAPKLSAPPIEKELALQSGSARRSPLADRPGESVEQLLPVCRQWKILHTVSILTG